MPTSFKEVRKFLVAACGVIAIALSAGLVGGTARTVLTTILAIATAAGVYVVPNVTVPNVRK